MSRKNLVSNYLIVTTVNALNKSDNLITDR